MHSTLNHSLVEAATLLLFSPHMPGADSATPRHCLSVFRAASRKARLNRNTSTDRALLGNFM
jgi:hypothetical protein